MPTRPSIRLFIAAKSSVVGLMAVLSLLVGEICSAKEPVGLDLEVDEDGVYVLSRGDLLRAGVPIDAVDPRSIGLYNDGKPEPIWIFGEKDGRLDPNDTIMFYGRYPRGKTTTRRIQNDINHYYLRWNKTDPLRFRANAPYAPESDEGYPWVTYYRGADHIERNWTLERFYHPEGEETDYYFWFKLTPALEKKDRTIVLYHHVYPWLPSDVPNTFDLKIKFYGRSEARVKPQHYVQVLVGEKVVGEAKWNGVKEYTLYLKNLPVALLGDSPGSTTVEIRLPPERIDSDFPQAVLLDWIEFSYWRATQSRDGLIEEFNSYGLPTPRCIMQITGLRGGQGDGFLINLTHGELFQPHALENADGQGYNWLFYPDPDAPADYVMVDRHYVNLPRSLRLIYRENFFAPSNQADMIVISHPEFMEEAEELAAYRRSQGLTVLVTNLQHIYDHFSHGFMDDQAIKKYIVGAWENYQPPKPRYILLVGDATRDFKHLKWKNDRNLLPIHWLPSRLWKDRSGGYASDNWYVAPRGTRPEMAIGRLPVSQPGQLTAILEKIKAYEKAIEEQPAWADRAILLTSIEKSRGSKNKVAKLGTDYLSAFKTKLLSPTAGTSYNDTEYLKREMNKGCSIIYYHGHGGSFDWRVGPVDYRRQKDLFTAEHVRELENKGRYPIILATTCYSASFDAPLSIGETFLTAPDKGAVALVATAWKSVVQDDYVFNKRMMKKMYIDGVERLGDAFLLSKQELLREGWHEAAPTFILLGDPALKILRPKPAG